MKLFGGAKLILIMILATFLVSPEKLPTELLGSWRVGAPYDTHQPVGLDASQEKFIRSLRLRYTPDRIEVCGKNITIQSIKLESLTSARFLQRYNLPPDLIGFGASPIVEVSINPPSSMNTCGPYENPGVHAFIGQNKHVVIEVANDYFPLVKMK